MKSKLNGAPQIRIDVGNWMKIERQKMRKTKHRAHFNQNIYRQQSLEGILHEIAALMWFFSSSCSRYGWKQDAFSTFHAFKRVNNHLSPEKNPLWSGKKRFPFDVYISKANFIRLNVLIRWIGKWGNDFVPLSSNDGFIINSKFNELCAKWHSSIECETRTIAGAFRAVSAVNLPLIRN